MIVQLPLPVYQKSASVYRILAKHRVNPFAKRPGPALRGLGVNSDRCCVPFVRIVVMNSVARVIKIPHHVSESSPVEFVMRNFFGLRLFRRSGPIGSTLILAGSLPLFLPHILLGTPW